MDREDVLKRDHLQIVFRDGRVERKKLFIKLELVFLPGEEVQKDGILCLTVYPILFKCGYLRFVCVPLGKQIRVGKFLRPGKRPPFVAIIEPFIVYLPTIKKSIG